MSFRGSHHTRMDEKGRMKMPADFKRVVDEKHGPRFYITSQDGERAEVYPLKVWEEIEEKLLTLGATSPVRKRFLDRTNFYGQEVEMDSQGRLLLPQVLREKAMLKDEVVVLGMTNFLQVANKPQFEDKLEPVSDFDAEVLARAGI